MQIASAGRQSAELMENDDDDQIMQAFLEASMRDHQEAEDAAFAEDWQVSHVMAAQAAAGSGVHEEESEASIDDTETTTITRIVRGDNDDHQMIMMTLAASLQEHREAEDAALAEDLQVAHVVAADDAAMKMEKALVDIATRKEQDDDTATVCTSAGAWDCESCTYRNPPFYPSCQACEKMPPVHILTFRRLQVPDVRFGVEVEIIIERGRRDGYTEPWVAAQLTQLGILTEFAGYSHITTPDGRWKIVTDASLVGTSVDDLCIEVVSPILCGETGLDQFRYLLEGLRCLGIATNETCGFHVHVDATSTRCDSNNGPSRQALPGLGTLRGRKRVAHAFCCLEAAFDEIVARAACHTQSRRTNRNQYCQSNVLLLGSRSRPQMWDHIDAATNVHELVARICPDRYYKLNLHNLTNAHRADTIEFRQHGGVDDAVAAEAWVRLVLGFVTQMARQTAASIAMPPQPYRTEQDLQQLFALVDCPGLESFYTMDRRLFQLSANVKEWSCKVCHRRFLRSQDLARHARATNHR